MYEWYALSFTVENTGFVNFMFTSFFGSISILNSLWNSPRYINIPPVDHPLLFSPNVKSEIDGICHLELWIQQEQWMVGRIFQKCPVTVSANTRADDQEMLAARKWLLLLRSLPCKETPIPAQLKKKRRQSLSREHDRHIFSTRARTRHEKENNQEHNQEYSYSLLASHFFPFLFLNWSNEWIGNLGTCTAFWCYFSFIPQLVISEKPKNTWHHKINNCWSEKIARTMNHDRLISYQKILLIAILNSAAKLLRSFFFFLKKKHRRFKYNK